MTEEPAPIVFPDAPRSQLERTIEELVDRAQAVLRTQGRLRSLLQATRTVVDDLELEGVLRRLVEAAARLVDAEYGAVAVIGADARLQRFVEMDDRGAHAWGRTLLGDGMAGSVVTAGPMRVERLADYLPDSDLPDELRDIAFLAVPIRVRGEQFGQLFLTAHSGQRFTEEDEELAGALVATASIAIENANLFEEARRRERWTAAIAETTAALLANDTGTDGLDVIADSVASLVDARLVCIVESVGDGSELRIRVARGDGAETIVGNVYPAEGSLVGRALESGAAAYTDGAESGAIADWQPAFGPTYAVPLTASDTRLGVLTITRPVGGPGLSDTELEMAHEFAVQASVALEVARGRIDRRRLELAEDRARIARDLHDHVIQRLFATGLSLGALASAVPDQMRPQLDEQVDSIDAVIRQIRTAVFALNSDTGGNAGTLRHRLLDVIFEHTPTLDSTPRLSFHGPIDVMVDAEVSDDVLAVVRESLSNIARHAQANASSVEVSVADGWLTVNIDDDGRGPGDSDRRSGLANLDDRARQRGGTYAIAPRDGGGTHVEWRVPLGEYA
ncbi:GAF domain-containing protein [Diaminobutyricimonas aerilata]|uniref:GAF domain-containing protein n=1 Tax=Diaminobutyricimonas aerilata TaxID=1162967 RepID=A0A2M9CG47_9MICO|nr:GAF domain-containing protein [Diaminobutyricimonas aerilata]PJJ70859.1 GAF domain-containing protein [Diaminobutyricimonas aerilata]